MAKQCFNFVPHKLVFVFFYITIASAQTPAAPAGPINITKVLEKAGQFTTFIKLLTATQVADRINAQHNNSNQGLTIFAPTDDAFSNFKAGTLNSVNSQEQLQLVQFHVLPNLYTMSQFQTASNPLSTQAGHSGDGQFPLNVTTSGTQVNVTTGVVTATVANTIYSDSQLAVYQVDQVLLPLGLFGPSPTAAPAPAPTKPRKDVRASDAPTAGNSDTPVKASGTVEMTSQPTKVVAFMVAVITMTVFL